MSVRGRAGAARAFRGRSDAMTLLDILILIVAAALVFELRRALGRRRRDDAADRKPSSLDQYIRHAQERERRRSASKTGGRSDSDAARPASDNSRDIGFAEAVRDALAGEPTVHPLGDDDAAADNADGARGKAAHAVSRESAELLADFLKHEPGFREAEFLSGARYAYEQILEAWAVNDYESLDTLLGDPARAKFFESMRGRGGKKEWRATNLVSILSAKIIRAVVAESHADLEVEFHSEQFESLRGPRRGGSSGAEGGSPRDAGPLGSVREVWRFRRMLGAGDPNWLLVETRPLAEPLTS